MELRKKNLVLLREILRGRKHFSTLRVLFIRSSSSPFFKKKKKNYHLGIQLFLYVSNLTEQLSASYTSK